MPLPCENGTAEYTIHRLVVRPITFLVEICMRLNEYSSTITILNEKIFMELI